MKCSVRRMHRLRSVGYAPWSGDCLRSRPKRIPPRLQRSLGMLGTRRGLGLRLGSGFLCLVSLGVARCGREVWGRCGMSLACLCCYVPLVSMWHGPCLPVLLCDPSPGVSGSPDDGEKGGGRMETERRECRTEDAGLWTEDCGWRTQDERRRTQERGVRQGEGYVLSHRGGGVP